MARPPKFTDDEILEVACRCFLEQGPSTPTSVVAAELGVSEAALYKRFGTKHELMVRALRPPERPGFLPMIEAGPVEDRPIRDQLRELTHGILGFVRGLVPRLSVCKAAGISPIEILGSFDVPPPVLAHRALSSWLGRAVEMGKLEVEDTDSLAFVVMGALHGRTMLTNIAGPALPDFDGDVYVEQLVDMLLDGVRARADEEVS